MLTVAELVATLGLDDRALERDLGRSLDRAEGRVSRFGGAAKAALAAGLGGGLVMLARTGYQEVMDAAQVQAQIEAGLKSTGGAAGVTKEHLEELAAAIQDYSGQTDDSIAQSEALLLTFTNIKNVGADRIFDEATKAAADMAAKLGTDASSAAMQLGKALNDPVKGLTALRRVGVSFTEEQRKQIKAMVEAGDIMGAQKIILHELQVEFGGAAKAAGESLPGQRERAKRAFEDASQEVMSGLAPALGDAAGLIRELAPAVPTLVKVAGAFTALWAAVKGYKLLKDAYAMMRDFIGLTRRSLDAVLDLGGGLRGVGGAGMGAGRGIAAFLGKAGLVGAALGASSVAVYEAVKAFQSYREAAQEAQAAADNALATLDKAVKAGKTKTWGTAEGPAGSQSAEEIRKAIERDRDLTDWWNPFSWFGDGGTLKVSKPTVIGVGEKGEEIVEITPTGRGTKGGRSTVIHIHGVPSRRQLEQLKRDLASVDIGGY